MSILRPSSESGVIFCFLRADFKKMSAQWENKGNIIFAVQKCMTWGYRNGITLDCLVKMPDLKIFFRFSKNMPSESSKWPLTQNLASKCQNGYFWWFWLMAKGFKLWPILWVEGKKKCDHPFCSNRIKQNVYSFAGHPVNQNNVYQIM